MNEERVRFDPNISAAIRSRNLDDLQHLLMKEPEQLRAFTPFAGGTWMHFAAREGDIDAVRLLISLGLDIDVESSLDGRTAICDACRGGHEGIVRLLLNNGAKLDTSSSSKNPLFSAILGRNLSIAILLLDFGVDSKATYNSKTMKSMNAISFALEQGEVKIAEEVARRIAKKDSIKISDVLSKAKEVVILNSIHKS